MFALICRGAPFPDGFSSVRLPFSSQRPVRISSLRRTRLTRGSLFHSNALKFMWQNF